MSAKAITIKVRYISIAVCAALVTAGVFASESLSIAARSSVLLPRQYYDFENGIPLTKAAGLESESIYLFKTDMGAPKRLRPAYARSVENVALSPRGHLIAGLHYEPGAHNGDAPRLVTTVTDSTGVVAAAFPGAERFAWSPGGSRLAVVFARRRAEKASLPDSLVIWNSETKQRSVLPVKAFGVAWRDENRLVLDLGTHRELLNIWTGDRVPSPNAGMEVSQDSAYSVSNWSDDQPRVWDDRGKQDITVQLLQLTGAGKGRLQKISPPFWVASERYPHLLCLPVCVFHEAAPGEAPRAKCAVYLLDVDRRQILRRIEGQGVVAAGDKRGILVLESKKLRVVDLGGF